MVEMHERAVPDKYRGTKHYHRVFAALIEAAQYRGTMTYQDVAVIVGLPLTGSHMGSETGHLLGEISEDEVLQGRPMFSALVTKNDGWPGPGFFAFAKRLGKLEEGDDEQKFWEAECEAVYLAWRLKPGKGPAP